MKVLIKNIALFTASLFFCILSLFSLLSFRSDWIKPTNIRYKPTCAGKLNDRFLESQTIHQVDILFLGSSHCYRGFDTRLFQKEGLTTFNWGSSSQTPIQSALILSQCINQIQPKMIVLEIFPDLYNGNGLESTLDFISNTGIHSLSNSMMLQTNDVSGYNTWLYSVIKNAINPKQSIPCDFEMEQYVQGGYVEKLKFTPASKFSSSPIQLVVNDKQLNAIQYISQEAKERHIPLVFVLAPMTAAYYNQYQNMEEMLQILNPYCDTIINFNPVDSTYQAKHFYDPHHLNQSGVEIFNRQLIPILKKEFPL